MRRYYVNIALIALCIGQITLSAQTTPTDTSKSTNNGSFWIGAGAKSGIASLTFAARSGYFGGDISLLFNNDALPQALDYSIPHSDYTIKTFKTASLSINGLLGLPIGETFWVYGLIGIAADGSKKYALSNVTYLYYTTTDSDGEYNYRANYGAGFQYNLSRHFGLGAQWSEFAGFQGQLAFVW